MELIDSEILVQHPCPFCELSEAFPEVSMAHWCNGRREVLEISCSDRDQLSALIKSAKASIHDLKVIVRSGGSVLAIRNCSCFKYWTVCSAAEENDCWVLFPIQYFDGRERYRIIAPGKEALNGLVNQLKERGTVKVVSVKPLANLNALQSIGTVPVHFFQGLTDKQLHALVSAYEKGLLDVPSKGRMDRIAKEEGFSRSTYGEHLKKALRRVVQNSYPMLKVYDSLGDKKEYRGG